jgi:16S rRNA (guanine527-N7)-methyltransferase
MSFQAQLFSEFASFQALSAAQLEALNAHHDILLKWNKKLNLCRIRDVAEAIQLHYCESLYLGLRLPPGMLHIVDVGSGAGFPGFPVGILRPESTVTLLESDQRKAAFLREACHGLGNFRVMAGRAEDQTERYDWMVSRAVRSDAIRQLRLAENVALLTTQPSAIKVPWGEQRFIEMFHVEL